MAKAKFFQRESLFHPKHVVHEVGDHEIKFYPVSLNMLWKLRTAFEPVIVAMRVLSAGKHDIERVVDQGTDDDGNKRVVTQMGAVTTELALMREERADKAWSSALDCIFGKESRALIGELLADSMRDEFTRQQAHEQDIGLEVMEALDLGTMVGMVNGLLKANARVFGPFAEKVRKAASLRINEALGEESELEEKQDDRTDSTAEAPEEDGEVVEPENENSSPNSES